MLVIDGMISGTWKKIIKKETVEVTVSLLRQLRKDEKEAVKVVAEEFGKFLELGSKLVINR